MAEAFDDLSSRQTQDVVRDLEIGIPINSEECSELQMALHAKAKAYADDLVILCREGKAEEALQRLREIMGKLKLTVNEEKTRICKVPEGEFDFQDIRLGGCTQREPARHAWAIGHRGSSIKRAVETVHALTARSELARDHSW